MLRFALVVCVSIIALGPAAARDLRVASWNLGWHMSRVEAAQWIRDCGQPFALNPETKLWEPSSTGQTKPGWELKWGRDAPIKWEISRKPPCDVYQANFKIVLVTEAAYDKRIAQMRRYVEEKLDADILTFQEVSGEQAVREILPGNGAAYGLCSFTGFKVQRLVIVWKRSLGDATDCLAEEPLSLPGEIEKNQVRPGLSVTLNVDGGQLRIMTVHLKSSCVSPIEAGGSNPNRGKLEGPDEACQLLQKQMAPLERWLEARATVPIVLLGDFNRNLAQELSSITADRVRTDGSAAETSIAQALMNAFRD